MTTPAPAIEVPSARVTAVFFDGRPMSAATSSPNSCGSTDSSPECRGESEAGKLSAEASSTPVSEGVAST